MFKECPFELCSYIFSQEIGQLASLTFIICLVKESQNGTVESVICLWVIIRIRYWDIQTGCWLSFQILIFRCNRWILVCHFSWAKWFWLCGIEHLFTYLYNIYRIMYRSNPNFTCSPLTYLLQYFIVVSFKKKSWKWS